MWAQRRRGTQILAEGFSRAGVPVFMSDVKGDLSGLAKAGDAGHKLHDAFQKRVNTIGLDDFSYEAFPVTRRSWVEIKKFHTLIMKYMTKTLLLS